MSWHHQDCEGECIACLIEREIQNAYGKQGLDYLRRHTTAPPQREFIGLTEQERDEICLGDEAIARAIEAKLKEKNT